MKDDLLYVRVYGAGGGGGGPVFVGAGGNGGAGGAGQPYYGGAGGVARPYDLALLPYLRARFPEMSFLVERNLVRDTVDLYASCNGKQYKRTFDYLLMMQSPNLEYIFELIATDIERCFFTNQPRLFVPRQNFEPPPFAPLPMIWNDEDLVVPATEPPAKEATRFELEAGTVKQVPLPVRQLDLQESP